MPYRLTKSPQNGIIQSGIFQRLASYLLDKDRIFVGGTYYEAE